jgi:hypothetical protein
MEELDIAALVRRVAGEVEAQTQQSGRRIEIAGPQGECHLLSNTRRRTWRVAVHVVRVNTGEPLKLSFKYCILQPTPIVRSNR